MNKLLYFCLCYVLASNSAYLLSNYHGQFYQDKYVNENFFKNKKNGIFVDIGAYDGITDSNTFFFEKELGWKGICIEPVPELFKNLKAQRSCILINGCVSDKHGKITFLKHCLPNGFITGLSKIIDKDNNINVDNNKTEIIKVKSYVLEEILRRHNIYHIDYLSLDIEGYELKILQNFPFHKYNIDVISVENNNNDSALKNLLRSKGYSFITKLGVDEIYKKIKKGIYRN